MKGEKNEIHKSNRVTFRRITQTKKIHANTISGKEQNFADKFSPFSLAFVCGRCSHEPLTIQRFGR